MGDLEKLVAEKLQQVGQESQQRAANYRDLFAKEKSKELSNLSKAEKILAFAEPVLREFARQIKKPDFDINALSISSDDMY